MDENFAKHLHSRWEKDPYRISCKRAFRLTPTTIGDLIARNSRWGRNQWLLSLLDKVFYPLLQRFFSTLYPLLPKWRARHQTTPFLFSRYKIIEISFKVIKYLLLFIFLQQCTDKKKNKNKKHIKYLLNI